MPFKNKEDYRKCRNAWRRTPTGMYSTARSKAIQRKIPWLFTFETWAAFWGDNIQYRGNVTGDMLVMARFGDSGPYAPNNVRIIPKRENDRERELLKRNPPEAECKVS